MIYRRFVAELFSRCAESFLIRKRRETGDGPICEKAIFDTHRADDSARDQCCCRAPRLLRDYDVGTCHGLSDRAVWPN